MTDWRTENRIWTYTDYLSMPVHTPYHAMRVSTGRRNTYIAPSKNDPYCYHGHQTQRPDYTWVDSTVTDSTTRRWDKTLADLVDDMIGQE